MDLKRLVKQFAYRIEEKPEGGFIARTTDPSVPPLEAPTREELRQKIQQNVLTFLSAEFPSLKPALENKKTEFSFHIEHNPDGGFALHSADPNAGVIEAGTQEEVESQFFEKMLGVAGKHLVPELSQALASQLTSGNIKVVVNRNIAFGSKASSHQISLGTSLSPTLGSPQGKDVTTSASFGTLNGTLVNSPITPEPANLWKVFRLILAVLIVGAMVYFFFRFR